MDPMKACRSSAAITAETIGARRSRGKNQDNASTGVPPAAAEHPGPGGVLLFQAAADKIAQLEDGRISDGIEYLQAFFAAFEQVRIGQRLQVTRHVGLRAARQFNERVHVLLAGGQGLQQAQAHRLGQHGEPA